MSRQDDPLYWKDMDRRERLVPEEVAALDGVVWSQFKVQFVRGSWEKYDRPDDASESIHVPQSRPVA